MKRYIQEAINFSDDDMSTKLSSPANKNMHEVNPDYATLPKNQIEMFSFQR